jgi:hypothetical protein
MTLTILSEILIPQLYKLRRSLTKNLNCSSQLPIMRLLSRQAAMRLCADPAKGHYDMQCCRGDTIVPHVVLFLPFGTVVLHLNLLQILVHFN